MSGAVRTGGNIPCLPSAAGRTATTSPAIRFRTIFTSRCRGVKSSSRLCAELLEDNGLTLEDIDLFIPHQANLRIIEAVGDRLKLGSEKIFVNLDEYGNTSAASIPLGIGDACAQGRIRPGSRVLLSAFGGGFTWGAALLEF